jgi:hypothetical protein
VSLFHTLADVVGRLDDAGIPHMVAGSVASTYHGEPRTTQDVDIIINPSPEALQRFIDGLDRSRYYVGDAIGALEQRSFFNVIDGTTGWKVDLIVRRDRPFSRAEFERRLAASIGGTELHVATAEDTILAKLEWAAESGSERQRQDVVAMIRAIGTDLDVEHLRRWAPELGVGDALEDLLRTAG